MSERETSGRRIEEGGTVPPESSPVDEAATPAPDTTESEAAARTRPAGGMRRASMVMASGSLVSRVLGVVRGAMLSMCVGALVVNNAFNVANILPNYIYILLAGGLLNAILIPQITKAMALPDGGRAQVDRLVTLILVVIVPIGVAVTALAEPLISAINDSSGATFDLTVAFAYLTMPQVLCYSLYVLLGQILNARGQFAAYMWAPVLANVVQIAGMGVWLAQYGDITAAQSNPAVWTPAMVWWLAGTSTAGIVVQALALVIPLWRGGFRYRPRFDFRGHGLRRAGAMVGWAFGALLLSQAGGLFIQYVLSVVTDAHPDVAGYGIYTAMFTIFMIPHSLVTTSIVTAVFPRLSSAVNAGDVETERSLLTRALTTPAVGVIPLTLAAVALAAPGIRVLYPGYTGADVETAGVFVAMAIGMWPFGIRAIQERHTFAHDDGPATLRYQLITSGTALLFTLAGLVVPAEHAALVIAVGLSVSSLVGAAAYLAALQRGPLDLPLRSAAGLWGRLVVASVPGAVLAWGVVTLLGQFSAGALPGGRGVAVATDLGGLVLGGVLFAAVFLLAAKALRIREVDDMAGLVLGRIGRQRGR